MDKGSLPDHILPQWCSTSGGKTKATNGQGSWASSVTALFGKLQSPGEPPCHVLRQCVTRPACLCPSRDRAEWAPKPSGSSSSDWHLMPLGWCHTGLWMRPQQLSTVYATLLKATAGKNVLNQSDAANVAVRKSKILRLQKYLQSISEWFVCLLNSQTGRVKWGNTLV